jgi:hypothetical protein
MNRFANCRLLRNRARRFPCNTCCVDDLGMQLIKKFSEDINGHLQFANDNGAKN